MSKLVILGMNRPQTDRQDEALLLDPPGGAGHRLWKLAHHRTGITRQAWLDLTDRRNLLVGEWSRARAEEAAVPLREELAGRTVVMLGVDVAAMMWRQLPRPMTWHPHHDWIEIPHPSGLCRQYNNAVVREAVSILLGELIEYYSLGIWPLRDLPAVEEAEEILESGEDLGLRAISGKVEDVGVDLLERGIV